MGMKNLKRIFLAVTIMSLVMTVNAGSATMHNEDVSDNGAIDIDYLLATIDYWFNPTVGTRYATLQPVVDGHCSGNQKNPCGIVIHYNLSP